MNGIHDMGGMQDMGPIRHEENEPVFHEAWEGRVYALNRALGAWGRWNIDASRYGIEDAAACRLPEHELLREMARADDCALSPAENGDG